MLVVATAVFVYYTIWTLLMVWLLIDLLGIERNFLICHIALRRRRSSPTLPLSTTRMGDTHTSYPHTYGHSRRRVIPLLCHDSKQQKEVIEGETTTKSQMSLKVSIGGSPAFDGVVVFWCFAGTGKEENAFPIYKK